MVIDKPGARGHQRQGHQEQQVRRVADVHDIDAAPEADTEDPAELGHESDPVLDEIGRGAPRLLRGSARLSRPTSLRLPSWSLRSHFETSRRAPRWLTRSIRAWDPGETPTWASHGVKWGECCS